MRPPTKAFVRIHGRNQARLARCGGARTVATELVADSRVDESIERVKHEVNGHKGGGVHKH